MLNLSRSKKKTDQKAGYEVKKVERLVLYVIGKSGIPLSAYEIGKGVVKQMPPGAKEQKYTYIILKRLVPHERDLPDKLLFSIDDFFASGNSIKEIPIDEKRDKLKKRVIHNVFKSYLSNLGGKEDDWECNMQEKEQEGLVVSINHRKERNTVPRFVFRKLEGSDQLSTALFYDNEEIRLFTIRGKGKTKIYSIKLFPDLHHKHYLDEVPKRSSSDVEFSNELVSSFEVHQVSPQGSARKDSQFVLNLRGLLHYLLLNKQKNKIEYRQMNEVIETLAEVDRYHDLEEEFKAMEPVRSGTIRGDKIFLEKKISNYKIKERFPFLSYYNEYKECLSINFAVDTLYEIATDLQNKLEELNIFDLKYEVTQRFFERIERFFWGLDDTFPSESIISSMNPEFKTIRSVYRNYQQEIIAYIRTRKEKENKLLEKRGRDTQEELDAIDFKQKVLDYIENEHTDIISSSEIIRSNDTGMAHPGATATQIKIFKHICKFERHDYQFGWYHFFKRSLIEEIDKLIAPEMDYETVKRILMEKGIYEEGVLTEILNLNNYNINFDKKIQIYRIVRKHIPK